MKSASQKFELKSKKEIRIPDPSSRRLVKAMIIEPRGDKYILNVTGTSQLKEFSVAELAHVLVDQAAHQENEKARQRRRTLVRLRRSASIANPTTNDSSPVTESFSESSLLTQTEEHKSVVPAKILPETSKPRFVRHRRTASYTQGMPRERRLSQSLLNMIKFE